MCLAILCYYWLGQYTDHGVEKGTGSAKNLEPGIEFGVTGALNVGALPMSLSALIILHFVNIQTL